MILLGITESVRMSAMELPEHTGRSYSSSGTPGCVGDVLAQAYEVFGVTRLNAPQRTRGWRRPPPAVPRRLFGAAFAAAAPKRGGRSRGALQ